MWFLIMKISASDPTTIITEPHAVCFKPASIIPAKASAANTISAIRYTQAGGGHKFMGPAMWMSAVKLTVAAKNKNELLTKSTVPTTCFRIFQMDVGIE